MTKAKDSDELPHGAGCKCDDCMDAKPFSAKDANKMFDGIKEMMAELRAKKDDTPAPAKDKAARAKDAEMDDPDDEEAESMDSFRKSVDSRFKTLNDTFGAIRDGLEELLKAKGEKPEMKESKGSDSDDDGAENPEQSNTPPTQEETDPEEETKEEEGMTHSGAGEDDDVDEIPALPPADRPKNPIPGADAALSVLKGQRAFYANPKNFANKKAFDSARTAFNAQLRALKGRDGRSASGTTYGDVNNPKRPDNLSGKDQAPPKTAMQKGAEYETMINEQGKKMRDAWRKGAGIQ